MCAEYALLRLLSGRKCGILGENCGSCQGQGNAEKKGKNGVFHRRLIVPVINFDCEYIFFEILWAGTPMRRRILGL
ncbi:MAG: hypothetical protein IJF68_04490 [Opitutales bacterium]|nr:hypothetical protein [Opitutales bacterium]